MTQAFYLPPEEFERRLRDAVMHDGSLPPNVRRQYTGMLGGFALAREDYALAAECYAQQAELTQLDGVPGEEAQAHYCLGNVRMAQGDYAAAEAAYARSLELALANRQRELTGLVLVQLGTAPPARPARRGGREFPHRPGDGPRRDVPPMVAFASTPRRSATSPRATPARPSGAGTRRWRCTTASPATRSGTCATQAATTFSRSSTASTATSAGLGGRPRAAVGPRGV